MPAQLCDWYLITCLTHLHAGRGDTNYDIVDKEVQRDPIDELPIIHASSLKGALREWFRQQQPGEIENGKQRDHPTVNRIFGNDTKGGSTDFGQGSHQFFEGRLLALPVRSSHLPFFLATSPSVLTDCLAQVGLYGRTYEPRGTITEVLKTLTPQAGTPLALTTQTITGELMLDEYAATVERAEPLRTALHQLLGYEHIALFHDDDLKDVAGRLPVIARNNLENGRSVNLWYEEVAPRQTRFSFFVRHPAADTSFEQTLAGAGGRVQVGANATIGYGQCTLSKLPTT